MKGEPCIVTMEVIKQSIVIIVCVILNVNAIKFYKSERPLPIYRAQPCEDETIISVFQEKLATGYNVTINKDLGTATSIRLKFDSQAAVLFDDSAKFAQDQDVIQNIFVLVLLKSSSNFTFNIRGHAVPFAPPYLTSLRINNDEFCNRPNLTYFRDFPVGVLSNPDRSCGRRKVLHTELIYQGYNTKHGDWPWHAAIYRYNNKTLSYICGGTLISKHFVLTAAHCATIIGEPVPPSLFEVDLGKYQLNRVDVTLVKKEVETIYVHNMFRKTNVLSNDIALLKLKTEAVFNNYVQPACLWEESVYDRLPIDAYGTVVGFGFDQSDSLSSTLLAANMPLIPIVQCTLSKPEFYGYLLRDTNRFCAGFNNGTSACNGDSGGAFSYFIPDIVGYTGSTVPGAYYVKGIVSTTLARPGSTLCDPNAYAIFTDVAKYLSWIHNIIDNN
ncbi:chymotrypsin-like elastase family member 2A [Bicyclus anynana]|uniref:Chymotrypsin-like elastase family member 2A n=1 Tax=Bicyclus anynana TaxID=110368 RepID=A0ABM3LX90_BICAN|nr:chymotrypsin-like elastase family member 2A [Bicyclus anynana]